MTQPPNPGSYGPPNSGWQQQPPPYSGNQPGYGTPSQPPYGPGQPQYGGGPGYGPGGYGPGGPRRPRTLLYVVIAVVGVLAVLGVVALIVPGLVGDDEKAGPTVPSPASSRPTDAPQPTTEPSVPSSTPSTSSSAPPASGPRLTEAGTLATKFLGLLNANDKKHALALGCTDSKQLLEGLLVFVDPPTKLSVTGPATSVSSYYPKISVPFAGTNNGSVPWAGTVDIMDVPSQPLCVRLMSRSR